MRRHCALIFAHDKFKCFELFKAAGQDLGGDFTWQLPLQFVEAQVSAVAEEPNDVYEPLLCEQAQHWIERTAGRAGITVHVSVIAHFHPPFG